MVGLNAAVAEEIGVSSGLISAQLAYALHGIYMGYSISVGLSPLFIVMFGSFITSFVFLIPSIYFERNKWPQKLSLRLLGQFMLIAFAGVALFQTLMLYGMKKTTPILMSVMPNLTPGFIFVIAWLFRFEKVDIKCLYSKVKIIGTVGCIIGAILMSSLHSKISHDSNLNSIHLDKERIIGTTCMIAGVIVLSLNINLQAATLDEFPAPMTLNTISQFFGAIFSVFFQLAIEHRVSIGSLTVNPTNVIALTILGSIISGSCDGYQMWGVKKKGPVFVYIFQPVNTLFSVIITAYTFGDSMTFYSLIGMFLIFVGLYSVLWAKKKESFIFEDDTKSLNVRDSETPLLI